jgi:hypothetical protein
VQQVGGAREHEGLDRWQPGALLLAWPTKRPQSPGGCRFMATGSNLWTEVQLCEFPWLLRMTAKERRRT